MIGGRGTSRISLESYKSRSEYWSPWVLKAMANRGSENR